MPENKLSHSIMSKVSDIKRMIGENYDFIRRKKIKCVKVFLSV